MLESRAGVRAEADFLRDVARWLHELMRITADGNKPPTSSSSTRTCLSAQPTPSSSRSRGDPPGEHPHRGPPAFQPRPHCPA
jgi:hypothetical protein